VWEGKATVTSSYGLTLSFFSLDNLPVPTSYTLLHCFGLFVFLFFHGGCFCFGIPFARFVFMIELEQLFFHGFEFYPERPSTFYPATSVMTKHFSQTWELVTVFLETTLIIREYI
jgi:hypothetical protein